MHDLLNEYAITYFTMLRHAFKIIAQEDYQKAIITMIPHLSKEARTEVLDSFKNIFDENNKVSNDIISQDRKRLRALISGKKWQKQLK